MHCLWWLFCYSGRVEWLTEINEWFTKLKTFTICISTEKSVNPQDRPHKLIIILISRKKRNLV